MVLNVNIDLNIRHHRVDARSGDGHTPRSDPYRPRDGEPHMAIQAGAGVPARGLTLVDNSNRQQVCTRRSQMLCDIKAEGTVTIDVRSKLRSVQPNRRFAERAVEADL